MVAAGGVVEIDHVVVAASAFIRKVRLRIVFSFRFQLRTDIFLSNVGDCWGKMYFIEY